SERQSLPWGRTMPRLRVGFKAPGRKAGSPPCLRRLALGLALGLALRLTRGGLRFRLGAASAAADVTGHQVHEIARFWGGHALPAVVDHLVLAAGLERNVVRAERAIRRNLGGGVDGQANRAVDAHVDDGEVGMRIETFAHDPSDLDAAHANVAA